MTRSRPLAIRLQRTYVPAGTEFFERAGCISLVRKVLYAKPLASAGYLRRGQKNFNPVKQRNVELDQGKGELHVEMKRNWLGINATSFVGGKRNSGEQSHM